jgi:hypothetical protein
MPILSVFKAIKNLRDKKSETISFATPNFRPTPSRPAGDFPE